MENVALSMREVADKYNEEKEQRIEKAHQDYITETMLPAIEELATIGKYQIKYSIPCNFNPQRIMNLLTSIGFTCENYGGSYLAVKW